MQSRLQDYPLPDMNRLPVFLPRHLDGPPSDMKHWVMSDRSKSCSDRTERKVSIKREDAPAQSYDIDTASTLATMAGGGGYGPYQSQPLSPTGSDSSFKSGSDGTTTSIKSESSYSPEESTRWPSPTSPELCPIGFPYEQHCVPLPRIAALDFANLNDLAEHYARLSAESRRNSTETVTRHSSSKPDRSQSHTPTPLAPMSSPNRVLKPKRKPSSNGSRCNVKYTIEQKDFIDYWRIDRNERETPWDDVVREYNAQFTGPHRRNGGLQSAYYRENKKIPLADHKGHLVFDEHDEVKTTEVPVRNAKARLNSIKSIGLLATHPERALQYPWVHSDHKRKVWKVGQARQAQLDAAMQRQRMRAERDARLARAQEQHSAAATDDHAFRTMDVDVPPRVAQRASRAVMSRL